MGKYLNNVAQTFKEFLPTHAKDVPLPTGWVADRNDCAPEDTPINEHRYPYRRMLGSTLYCSMARMDTQFCCAQLARVQNSPGIKHYKKLIQVAAHLVSTAKRGIKYSTTPKTVNIDHANARTFQAHTMWSMADASHADITTLCPYYTCTMEHKTKWSENAQDGHPQGMQHIIQEAP